MMKVFISQPMSGKSEEEIRSEREMVAEAARDWCEEEIEVIDSYFTGARDDNPLVYLGRSIQLMAEADLVYFARGWENARGCRIEYACAEAYDKEMAVEYDLKDHPDLQESVNKFRDKFGHLFGGEEDAEVEN